MGGPIQSIAALAEHLVQRGHHVTVVTSNGNANVDIDVPLGEPVNVEGVEVWYFARQEPLRKWFPFVPYLAQSTGFSYTPELAPFLTERIKEFDLVHCHSPYTYPSVVAGRQAVEREVPVFYSQRGSFLPEAFRRRNMKKRLFLKLFEKKLLENAVSLVALTKREEKAYRDLGFLNHIDVVPTGIDPTPFKTEQDGMNGVPVVVAQDNLLVLYLGRLHPHKGFHLLIEVFFQIAGDVPKAHLVLAGPDEVNIRSKYEREIKQRGLADRIMFVGRVDGEEKCNLLARADLFCLPSASEGFSNAVLEALCSGTPVALTPNCNFPEVAQHKAGWMVERDIAAWADTLRKVLQQPSKLHHRAANARDLVLQHYTWDLIVDRMEQAYYSGIKRFGHCSAFL